VFGFLFFFTDVYFVDGALVTYAPVKNVCENAHFMYVRAYVRMTAVWDILFLSLEVNSIN
jgi:hypothetical protein